MLSIIDFFNDLTNPALAFLPRAVLVTCVAACVCAVVGCHVVLRGMSFIGDAVAHSVFPGLAIAFVCSGSLVLGGTLAGVGTAVLVALLSQNRRLKEDSIIGVLFVGAFGLGLVIISWAPGYAGSLQDFLFGSLTGIPASEVPFVLVASALILGVFAFFHKEIPSATSSSFPTSSVAVREARARPRQRLTGSRGVRVSPSSQRATRFRPRHGWRITSGFPRGTRSSAPPWEDTARSSGE